MKKTSLKLTAIVALLLCVFCFSVQSVLAAEGTDGTELQLMEAEQLEIQLGVEWSGVAFQLKTDAGLYPGVITVGEDGVLRLEIGGSSSYVLSCLGSSAHAPDPAQAPATTGSAESTGDEPAAEQNAGATIAGIPVLHLILFGGGLIIAVVALILMHAAKNRTEDDEYESDEDE